MPTLCIVECKKSGSLYVDESKKSGALKVAARRAKKEILIKAIAPTIHSLIEQAEIKRIQAELDKVDGWQALRIIETYLERADVDVDKIMVSLDKP